MKTDRTSVDDKLMELQEMMQRLQILKQLGADNLVIEQEKEIFQLQKDLMDANKETPLDIVDTLPRKCRFCEEPNNDDERLECYEKQYKTCKKHEPTNLSSMTTAFLRVILAYGFVIILILIFSLITDVLFKYITDSIIVFSISVIIVVAIVILLRNPIKKVMVLLK
jgi:hypothetical protein